MCWGPALSSLPATRGPLQPLFRGPFKVDMSLCKRVLGKHLNFSGRGLICAVPRPHPSHVIMSEIHFPFPFHRLRIIVSQYEQQPNHKLFRVSIYLSFSSCVLKNRMATVVSQTNAGQLDEVTGKTTTPTTESSCGSKSSRLRPMSEAFLKELEK